ncbi:MAG: uroporphyrinogen-III synthase [Bacteroidota bacterium]
MKRVFISRNLKPSSPIRKVLGNHTFLDISLIRFGKLDFEAPQADWIFFYSRNGVRYFFQDNNYELYPFLWACMNEGTADELSHYVTNISFVGNGTPNEVAQSFKIEINTNQVVCFIRAKNSMDSILKQLGESHHFSIPVYTNDPIDGAPDQSFDILIFTSPLNVDAWFKSNPYKNEKVISIGNTTADHIKESIGITNVIVAEHPSEEAIAKRLKQIL